MDLYGRGYVIDHVASFFRREQEEKRYRAYVTDALKALTENTTHRLIPGIGEVSYGSYMPTRWLKETQAPEDKRSGDEIAEEIIRRAGLKLKNEGDQ